MEKEISTLQKFINTAVEFLVQYGFQVFGAILILILGFYAGNVAAGALLKLMEKKKIDITLSKFLASCVRLIVIAFAVLVALGKFGITITPLVAALSAAVFGASLAIQGPLSNYGAGISIILGRPFLVGDTVSVCGMSGVVEDVKLTCTVLTNEDGIKITIPSKHIVGEIIQNSKTFKVAEGLVGIDYSSDPEKTIRLIAQILADTPKVTREPKPQIGIQEFGESSINIAYRYWVPTVQFYEVTHKVNMAVYQALKKANVEMPFPRRDIHIFSHEKV
jgi:small conductance mechanosensitive channel